MIEHAGGGAGQNGTAREAGTEDRKGSEFTILDAFLVSKGSMSKLNAMYPVSTQ